MGRVGDVSEWFGGQELRADLSYCESCGETVIGYGYGYGNRELDEPTYDGGSGRPDSTSSRSPLQVAARYFPAWSFSSSRSGSSATTSR